MASLDTAATPESLLDGADPEPLFEPYRLVPLELRNRFVLAPMTREHSPGGVPTDEVAAYYRRRAAHFGLLVTEGVYIDEPSSGVSDRVPRITGDDALDGWRRVVEAVHGEGGRIFPQLWHVGLARRAGAPPNPDAPVLSPSGIAPTGRIVGEPASIAQIDAVIEAFAEGARNAKAVGFDGAELHGAHGYLLDEFFWSVTNRRTDRYGGTLAARARLGAEVVAAVRDAVGPDYPITFRFSQWKGGHYDARIADTPAALETLLAPLVAAGISGFHVSTRRYWLPEFEQDGVPAGAGTTLAGWTKKLTGLPTITVGSVGVHAPFLGGDPTPTLSLAPLVDRFSEGAFDLVALGRAALSEPEWPTKLRERRLAEIRAYRKEDEAVLQ